MMDTDMNINKNPLPSLKEMGSALKINNNYSAEKGLDQTFNIDSGYKILGNFEIPNLDVDNTETIKLKASNGNIFF